MIPHAIDRMATWRLAEASSGRAYVKAVSSCVRAEVGGPMRGGRFWCFSGKYVWMAYLDRGVEWVVEWGIEGFIYPVDTVLGTGWGKRYCTV